MRQKAFFLKGAVSDTVQTFLMKKIEVIISIFNKHYILTDLDLNLSFAE